MPAHTVHHFKLYKNRAHAISVFGLIILPLVYILLVGQISPVSTHQLLFSLGLSLYRLFFAYLISLVIAIILAITLGLGRLGSFFVPIFDLVQNLPSFALIPVFLIIFGYTNQMAIIFAATSMIWPILFYILNSLKTARTDYNEAATIFGATGLRRITSYFIPLSFPAIVTGSLVSLSIGWEAIIGIEIIGLSNGIGFFLNATAAKHGSAVLTLGIIALLLVVFSINRLVWLPLLKKSQLYAE